MKCDNVKTFEQSLNNADGIFLGELVEIKQIIYDTTHQGIKKYFDGRFKVKSSWKLIDKQYVWINLPGKETPCINFNEGKSYLIYVNQLNNELFISDNSRSSEANTDLAKSDLMKLDVSKITISSGEFSTHKSPFYDISIALFIIAIIVLLIYKWIKKSKK